MFSCLRCQSTGWDGPERRSGSAREWTDAEKADIIDTYWRVGEARCPADGAVLEIERTPLMGAPPLINVTCGYCGTYFQDPGEEAPGGR